MAGLWSARLMSGARRSLRHMAGRAALTLALVILPGCTELAQPTEALSPGTEPPYVSLAAKHLRSVLVDRSLYDGFEISPVRWVHAIRGWAWLTCVHFRDRGHPRTYAIFIHGEDVVDARYAVETDACESQTYTQFDLISGAIGRPTAPVQSPLY
jgi:hypothetical protein